MPRWLSISLIVLVVLLLAGALAAPLGPVPGFRLGGTEAAPPARWSDLHLPHEVLLQTSGGLLPRVVTIWVVETDNELYVFGSRDSGWVESALRSPAVRLRVEDTVYSLRAEALQPPEPDIYRKYVDRYAADYPDIIAQMPSLEEAAEVGMAFRLQRP